MKKYQKITLALASATACLSGVSVTSAAELGDKSDFGKWDINTAVLFYNEADRVSAIEPVIIGTKQIDTDEALSVKFVIDSLTGASASGAVPTDYVQTFTTPSGNGTYEIAPGETPLDTSFLDTRFALSTSWVKPISRLGKMTLGANASKEYDYTSLSVSGLFAYDINNRNTTLSAGLSLGSDTIDTVGDIPIAFGIMQPEGQTQPRRDSSEDKTLVDLVFGVTQVLDQNSLLVFNYSLGQSDGYLNDPYKVISVVDSDSGNPNSTIFENRPDTRTKHALFAQYKRYFTGNVLDASYRYATDDWGIDSNTIDVKYKFRLSDTSFIQPHVRLYSQTQADFYVPYLVEGQQALAGDTTSFATADYRLGEFTGTTIGLEYGKDNIHRPWSVALEYYVQSGDEPANKIGQLSNKELFPDVSAVMLRINYDF